MGFEWNLSQRFLHMLGRNALKIFQRNLRHWEIGRSEVQNTFETVESAGTSNPKPPRSFQRGGEPSFKDWRVLDGWKVEIAIRAWDEVRGREDETAAVKMTWRRFDPDPLAVYIANFYYPEYPVAGPEYSNSPEYPGPGPKTPAPLDTEQIWHSLSLI